jgi:perosamine synthetase
MEYPIYTPDIARYTTSIRSALEEGWISSQGEFLAKAREEAVTALGSPYVVLVNNGTSATHLLYKALKFRHPEITTIYVPNSVFVAVWNCALYEYPASALRVLEVDETTLNLREDEAYLQTLEAGAAVVVVHNVGTVVDVPRLKRLRPDLVFVEDCCEAFLETYEGGVTGTASLCGAVSFFANKLVTTGEGGLWYTNDKELYEFIHKSCHHGMTSERYVYDVLGYNYRMTNLQAALLYDQLRDINQILTTKRRVRDTYCELLGDAIRSRGLWMTLCQIPHGGHYPEFAAHMAAHRIDTRPMFYPLQTHAHLREIPTPQTLDHSTLAMLPSSPGLTRYDQAYIATAVRQFRRPHQLTIVRATLPLLREFVANSLPSTFRYFVTRDPARCLETHTLTLLGLVDGIPVSYGHLDDRWVGLCVLPHVQGRGYGSLLLDLLCAAAETPLRLTVDRTNDTAYKLYLSRGFRVVRTTETCFCMENDK